MLSFYNWVCELMNCCLKLATIGAGLISPHLSTHPFQSYLNQQQAKFTQFTQARPVHPQRAGLFLLIFPRPPRASPHRAATLPGPAPARKHLAGLNGISRPQRLTKMGG
jgi:hypothetical protein